jgi:hypothetical protein
VNLRKDHCTHNLKTSELLLSLEGPHPEVRLSTALSGRLTPPGWAGLRRRGAGLARRRRGVPTTRFRLPFGQRGRALPSPVVSTPRPGRRGFRGRFFLSQDLSEP